MGPKTRKEISALQARNIELVAALSRLYQEYVVEQHGPLTCDCDPSVGIYSCAPCMARTALAKEDEA